IQDGDRRAEQQTIHAVQETAMARDQHARILDTGLTLEKRLDQVADDSRRPDRKAVAGHQQRTETKQYTEQQADKGGHGEPGERTLDRLLRADAWSEACPSKCTTHEERTAVAHP